jgi:myo-inositol-1(or 4)-monophosphatase
MSHDALADRLPIVAAIARRAGAGALAQRKSVTAERKSDQSFVTQADRAVEGLVRDELEAAFPGETILGEEMGRRGMVDAERVWLVDPIDGTTNYVHGIPFWCTAIGLLERGEAVLGAIYHPLLGVLYHGAAGVGAWQNDEPLRVWDERGPFTRTDPIAVSIGLLRRGLRFPAAVRTRNLGSAQLHFALVAAGACRAGLWTGDYAWDLVAGIAIVRAAGGVVRTFGGEEPDLRLLLDGRAQPWGLLACGAPSLEAMLAAVEPLRGL